MSSATPTAAGVRLDKYRWFSMLTERGKRSNRAGCRERSPHVWSRSSHTAPANFGRAGRCRYLPVLRPVVHRLRAGCPAPASDELGSRCCHVRWESVGQRPVTWRRGCRFVCTGYEAQKSLTSARITNLTRRATLHARYARRDHPRLGRLVQRPQARQHTQQRPAKGIWGGLPCLNYGAIIR